MALVDLSPDFHYNSVPHVSPHSFLQAKAKNTSPYTMLAGPANIFLDNNFIAKVRIYLEFLFSRCGSIAPCMHVQQRVKYSDLVSVGICERIWEKGPYGAKRLFFSYQSQPHTKQKKVNTAGKVGPQGN